MYITDTHCHLYDDKFEEDREKVIVRAVQAGVEKILVPGLDIDTSKAAVRLAENHEQIFAAVGVHPNSKEAWDEGTLNELKEMAQHPKVVAIGEIGLDYYWDKNPRYIQEQIFHHQLELAAELQLPVVIHNREATEDVVRKLANWKEQMDHEGMPMAAKPGVLHSFSASASDAEKVLDANFYIGITGPVTFKNADELREVVKAIPMDKILIETDSPYLTPVPHRGKRNEPANVSYVCNKIAELKYLHADEVAEMTTQNAKRLLNW